MVPTDWLVVKNILIRQLKLKFRAFSQRNQRASFTGWRRICVTTVSRIVIEEANPVAVAVSELSWFEHIVFCAIQKGRNASCKNRLLHVLKCFRASFFLRECDNWGFYHTDMKKIKLDCSQSIPSSVSCPVEKRGHILTRTLIISKQDTHWARIITWAEGNA